MIDTDWSEHYIKRGDPSKPTYYIIRRRNSVTGLFAIYKIFGEHIRYALSKGWLPVVDMQNYPNAYLPPEKLGKENSWEYFFEQPLRIGLEQAYNGENIVVNQEEVLPRLYETMSFFENRDNVLTEWRMLVKLGLLKIKPALMEEISAVHKKLFAPNDRMLGVLMRGTDYVAKRPHGHPIPPPMEFALSIIVEKAREWNCNKLFLATEDKNIVRTFKQVFGDRCIMFDREYVDYKPDNWISAQRIDRPNDHYLQGKDYMTQMVLLSKCNSLVAARCNGTYYATLISEKFENIYVFNLGTYGLIGLD